MLPFGLGKLKGGRAGKAKGSLAGSVMMVAEAGRPPIWFGPNPRLEEISPNEVVVEVTPLEEVLEVRGGIV